VIAPDTLGHLTVTHETKGHGGYRRPENATHDAREQLRGDDERAARLYGENEGTEGDRQDCETDQQPFRSDPINDCAPGCLTQNAGQAPHRQGDPDGLLVPMLGRQINRHERANACPDVGQEKVQPVEGAKALA